MTRSAISSLFALILVPTLSAAVVAAPALPREAQPVPPQVQAATVAAASGGDFDLATEAPQVTPIAEAGATVADLGMRLFADRVAASSCGPSFCTAAERTQCANTCLKQGHGTFVGLECCPSSCKTLCICGSRPVACS